MDSFLFTSQTKPGPNIAFAVAMKVARKSSIELKELESSFLKREDIGVGVGERVEKNW